MVKIVSAFCQLGIIRRSPLLRLSKELEPRNLVDIFNRTATVSVCSLPCASSVTI